MEASKKKNFLSPENGQKRDPFNYRRCDNGNRNYHGVKSQLLLNLFSITCRHAAGI